MTEAVGDYAERITHATSAVAKKLRRVDSSDLAYGLQTALRKSPGALLAATFLAGLAIGSAFALFGNPRWRRQRLDRSEVSSWSGKASPEYKAMASGMSG